MQLAKKARFNPQNFFPPSRFSKMVTNYRKGQIIFSQGKSAKAVFYVLKGTVKLTMTSAQSRVAVLAVVGVGDFLGEGCIGGGPLRTVTATAMTPCSVLQMGKSLFVRLLRREPRFSSCFIRNLISRNLRMEESLTAQLFDSSEKRLARALLHFAGYGNERKPRPIMFTCNQDTLAKFIGTTRSRVNFFMNRFRARGYIAYKGNRGLRVHRSLLKILLQG
jgi:CRP/FNR family transcriptional regulator, cyclic AMP receptor protein